MNRPPSEYRTLSLWHDTAPDDWTPRPALPGEREFDVAIVGAGFTGLWTALYLIRSDPSLRIAVLEREVAGFGASGRNGGWCSALFPTSPQVLARAGGRQGADALQQAMHATVDEVGAAAELDGIDCHYHKGGTVTLARTPTQWQRARAEVETSRDWGLGEADLRLLGAADARARLCATNVLGATFTPHCAAIHPARLVRGLATAVERRGVTIFERTPVQAISEGYAETAFGKVRADVVVRATEGFTASLRGEERTLAPVYSLMVATEPLSQSYWDEIGLRDRETFSDWRHLIIYGQRTADGRLAFGGRGAPYHFGSRTDPRFDRNARVFADLRRTLVELFPGVRDVSFTHAWGGPIGIARDWFASVGFDQTTGLAWAGGYVGDGVGTSNLAGRTLTDLILGRSTDLVALPWVGHRSPRWEPEPLRWLGVNGALQVMTAADLEEGLSRRSSLLARAIAPLTGDS
jgi:glycine/D-amino acid oxidase-like deaminating enzyme